MQLHLIFKALDSEDLFSLLMSGNSIGGPLIQRVCWFPNKSIGAHCSTQYSKFYTSKFILVLQKVKKNVCTSEIPSYIESNPHKFIELIITKWNTQIHMHWETDATYINRRPGLTYRKVGKLWTIVMNRNTLSSPSNLGKIEKKFHKFKKKRSKKSNFYSEIPTKFK